MSSKKSTTHTATQRVTAETLSRAADFALYAAKSAGRRRYMIYDEELEGQFLARRKMVDDLPDAIAKGEMEIFLQPKVHLATSEIYGFEALVRWRRDGVLTETGLPADLLTIEVTETAEFVNLDQAKPMLQEIQSMGARIAIDDFGAGFSSLAYLRETFADEVKIDRSLVNDLETSSGAHFLLDSVVEIAHNLGLEVTVEGIETQSQLRIICEMGPKNGQGYFWSKPMPADEALRLALEKQAFGHDGTKCVG